MKTSTIIISDNQYLILGLKNLASSYLLGEIEICSCGISAVRNIERYDFIFLEIEFNQTRLCLKNLIKRKLVSRLFFIQRGVYRVRNSAFLSCYKDAVILEREQSHNSVSQQIKDSISTKNLSVINFSDCCYRCRFPFITDKQLIIFIGYNNGLSNGEIAKVLHLSIKTVFSHVHKVKKMYNLRSSYDLHKFLQNELRCYQPIQIKNSVNPNCGQPHR